MNYNEFLMSKAIKVVNSGFDIKESELNNKLFDFQKYIVKKALFHGRHAVFADTGLGKTPIQLEFVNQIVKKENKPVLVLAPLAVSLQTIEQGKKFDIEVTRFNGIYDNKIYITNYEQLDNVDCSKFVGVVIDESSCIKNFTGKLRNQIIDNFKNTKYKLACTATPSPNDLLELGNHSEFLNVMSRSEMLSMFFIHDSGDTKTWRLKKHSTKHFYNWIGQWATVVVNPVDLGFDGKDFILPPINYYEEKIMIPVKSKTRFINQNAVNAVNFNQQLRDSAELRLQKVKDIIDKNINEQCIIWINQNNEGDLLKKLLNGYDFREVRGSDSVEKKEKDLQDFAKDKYKILITKSSIAGMGLNFQSCHTQIFAGLDFSFEKLYQAIRRCYRFGQKNEVNIYIITTDSMQNVLKIIKEKEDTFITLRNEMKNIINNNKTKIKEVKRMTNDVITDDYKLLQGDCIERIKEIESNSIGFSIFSPPFAELYVYSANIADIGNVRDYSEFFQHFKYLIPELYRIIQSGRLVAIHCMDLPIQKGKEGFIGLRDFSGMLVSEFTNNGFIYHDRITIWKDPVTEMQRTKALGLLHKQIKKDSSMCRTGNPDYLLIFRKDGENQNPIKNIGITVEEWQELASPVWMDIRQGNTLNKVEAKANEDEKHICPLQLDVIERAIKLWSNPDDTVFTPFMGIGSEVYQAIKMGRKGIGIELKDSYFEQAVKNVKAANAVKNAKFKL